MGKRKRNKKIEYSVNTLHTDQWALQIGKLMINYAALEQELSRWVVHLTERAFNDAEMTKESARAFGRKHEEISQLVIVRSPSEEWLGKVSNRLIRAKSIDDVRDQIAHSPLFSDDSAWKREGLPVNSTIPPTPRQRRSGRGSHLTFAALRGAVNDSAAVVQDLHNLLEQWRNAYKAGNVRFNPATLTWWQRIRRRCMYWWLRLRDA